MPGAGKLSPEQVQGYCIYMSPAEETIRAHVEMPGFPANSIQEVRTVIDPMAEC